MDEEENFAKLLSHSTTAAPTWNAPAESDPWANPFSDSPGTSNPFASPFGTGSAYVPAPISDPYTSSGANVGVDIHADVSPYVTKIEQDGRENISRPAPDMPSVIAARERDQAFASPFQQPSTTKAPGEIDDDDIPFGQRAFASPRLAQNQPEPTARKSLPSDLIDDDLLAASDPSLSLKKAFVKSSVGRTSKPEEKEGKPKAYVFSPSNKGGAAAAKQASLKEREEKGGRDKREEKEEKGEPSGGSIKETQPEARSPAQEDSEALGQEGAITPKNAASIPLPESTITTPVVTRTHTPTPPPAHDDKDEAEPSESSPSFLKTPTIDRVAVSPLDPPTQEPDFRFQFLSIGAASSAPPVPPKSPTKEDSGDWQGKTGISPVSRFGGKGWGALDGDGEDDGGLFGKGGPSVRSVDADPWGTKGTSVADSSGEGGWGEHGVAGLESGLPGPSSTTNESAETSLPEPSSSSNTSGASRIPKVLSKPLFQISVGDPTRIGDPVRGYTVYTVRTRTTSPHYRKGEFSVLRRFSDFLWLFETLTANNPGVIVPPVPDKHPFGRFQDTFIETRRMALERCLNKIAGHPVLQLDPDLRLFLESDQFAAESKTRRAEFQDHQQVANKGLLASWTGPKFVEQDDWFDSRRSFLDSLENQLKGLSKSIEAASKQRLDMATALGDFASSMNALADSDLGSAMCAALARLSDLANREKETNEEQAKAEVVHLLNLSDEYVRFISSVRLAFASRIKCYEKWQAAEKEVARLRSTREKARQQGKLGERGPQTLAEVGEAERRSRDLHNEFEAVSKLVKSEFGRFEKERVDEFKRVLERYLEGMIKRQRELIEAWEEYHGVVLDMVKRNQASLANGR